MISSIEMLPPEMVAYAHKRIESYIHRTPIFRSHFLNQWLGHDICFKMESLQKIGAFKIRGALNTALHARENGTLSDTIVAFSSGNHAQAVACAAKMLGVKAKIFLPAATSVIKQQATRGYGAEVIITPTRQEAEAAVEEEIRGGATFIHPYDHDDEICGQGTACLEALQDIGVPDMIFAPLGGGGLISGTWLAAQLLAPSAKVIACEPLQANDAAESLRQGHIVKYSTQPHTIADGAATLSVSERTFQYIRRLEDVLEIPEDDIIRWTQFISHLLKTVIEPTSALAVAGAAHWLKLQKEPQKVLIILSAGNVSPETYQKLWAKSYLHELPVLP